MAAIHRRNAAIGLFVVALASLGGAGVAKQAIAPETLVVPENHIISGSIDGRTMDFDVLTWGFDPILNPEPAKALGLNFSLLSGKLIVGTTRVNLKFKNAQFALGSQTVKQRVGWSSHVLTPRASGWIGPVGVPFAVVQYRLRPEMPGEHAYSFPMDSSRGGINTRMVIGNQNVFVGWDNSRERTIVSGSAAVAIVNANGGDFVGQVAKEIVQLNVERPTRHLRLATPLHIGPVSISDVSVRTAEDGDTNGISDADADPGEIVVTASSTLKVKPDYFIIIGMNDLVNCSSLTFDKPAKIIRLMCR